MRVAPPACWTALVTSSAKISRQSAIRPHSHCWSCSAKFVASVADLACAVSLQLDASARHVKVSNLDCFTLDMHRLYPTRGAVSRSAATLLWDGTVLAGTW